MKILCFIDNLGSGGAQRQLATLAVLFKERGHYVEFLTYYPDDFFLPILEKSHIPVKCINEAHPLKRILKIRKILRWGNQDIVLSFLDTPNFLSCLSSIGGRRWGLVVGERSADVNSFTNIRARFLKGFSKYADFIVTNSFNTSYIWVKYFPHLKDKIKTLYNIVLLEGHLENIEYIPKKDGKLHIIIAARYHKLKNMVGVIEAVNLLKEDEKNKLIIDWYGRNTVSTGDNFAFNTAIEKIDHYKLGNTIKLFSDTKDIIVKMYNADVIGLFSIYEGLPNSVCEGMSIGKPIIMSRVSDYDKLVDESNGFLCDAVSVKSILEAIRCALNTKTEKLLEMGKTSRRKARILFEKTTIVDNYLNLFNSVLRGTK